MGDEATTIYPIKYVVDASRPRDSQPVVVGPRTNAEESYSALAAVFNVLLLRNKFDVPSFGADSIASDTMIDLIGEKLQQQECVEGRVGIRFDSIDSRMALLLWMSLWLGISLIVYYVVCVLRYVMITPMSYNANARKCIYIYMITVVKVVCLRWPMQCPQSLLIFLTIHPSIHPLPFSIQETLHTNLHPKGGMIALSWSFLRLSLA